MRSSLIHGLDPQILRRSRLVAHGSLIPSPGPSRGPSDICSQPTSNIYYVVITPTAEMASVDAEKRELKAEGAIEAATELAQDPHSKVNPDTVEQTLVDETRKAGVPAYQFDPDASPEDKAAAAKAVRIRRSCLNNEKKKDDLGKQCSRTMIKPIAC